MSAENGISRRGMLVKLGLFLNGIVGVMLAVPIVRYLLSPVTRERKAGYESWLSLGALGTVSRGPDPAGDVSKSRRRSVGRTDRRYCMLGPERGRSEVPGLRHQLCAPGLPGSLVPAIRPVHVSRATAGRITGTARAPRDRRSGDLFEYHHKIEDGNSSSRLAKCRLPARPQTEQPGEDPMRLMQKIGAWFDQRLQLGTPIRETVGASGSAQDRELVVRLRQRRADRVSAPDRHRNSARPRFMCLRRERPGTACRSSITISSRAGSFERCTAGARISWSRSS